MKKMVIGALYLSLSLPAHGVAWNLVEGSSTAPYGLDSQSNSDGAADTQAVERKVSKALGLVSFGETGEGNISLASFDSPARVANFSPAAYVVLDKAANNPAQPNDQQSGCTPGVDCPTGKNGQQNGQTPQAPNYRARPKSQPSRVPSDNDRLDYSDDSVNEYGHWHIAQDIFGNVYERAGGWAQTVQTVSIARGGGNGQAASYERNVQSQAKQKVYILSYRWVGKNCDPNDSGNCQDWTSEWVWSYARTNWGATSGMKVALSFAEDKALLPWETETFNISYDGSKVGVTPQNAAFQYSVRGPIVDYQNGAASITLTPGARILKSPEFDKVSLSLINNKGQMQLVVDDLRDAYYTGETLQIAVKVKMDSGHWYKSDGVVYEQVQSGPISVVIQKGKHPQALINVPNQGAGTYYIKSWSFRRAQSAISSGDWSSSRSGNKVQR